MQKWAFIINNGQISAKMGRKIQKWAGILKIWQVFSQKMGSYSQKWADNAKMGIYYQQWADICKNGEVFSKMG